MIGDIVCVTVDRPLGSYHPKHKDIYYPINYGYIEGIIAPDGEEQDAYILGVDQPVERFTGKIIAIVHRYNDVEEKWVVCPENASFTKEEIMDLIRFQEQYLVSPLKKGFYSYQYDTETTNGQDGYAGSYGKTIDRFQVLLSK